MFKGLMIFREPDMLSSSDTSVGGQTEEVKTEEVVNGTEENQGQPKTSKAWMAQLPKELRDNAELEKFNTIGEMAQAYLSKGKVQEEVSKNFLESITQEPNAEEWKKFKDEFISDTFTEEDKKGLENYIDFVKKANLSPSQAKDLLTISKDVINSQKEEEQKKKEDFIKQAPKRCEKFLREKWADDYDKNIIQAKRGYVKLFTQDDEFTKSFKNSSYTNDPLIMELFNRVGSLFNEPQKAFESKADHVKEENGWGISEKFYK